MSPQSQTELEAPAKVYQLQAVDKKVDDVLKMLDEVLMQTKGVATHSDIAIAIEKSKAEMIEYVKDEIKKVHLEYRPEKDNSINNRRIVKGVVASIVIQGLLGLWLWMQSKL